MIFTRKLLWTQHDISEPEKEKQHQLFEFHGHMETNNMTEQEYLDELIERYPCLASMKEQIGHAYEILKEAYESGHKLLIAGNGGSAADSEHIAGELMKGFRKKRTMSKEMAETFWKVDLEAGEELSEKLQGALPAIALCGHPGLSTAFLNDVDGQLIFAQQVYGYGNQGDVLLAISTSGNSANIYYACVTAKAKGMKVIGLTGRDGGKLKHISDETLIVPESETFKIQELHLPIYHALCLMLETHFFQEEN